jgi:hypothetical protein
MMARGGRSLLRRSIDCRPAVVGHSTALDTVAESSSGLRRRQAMFKGLYLRLGLHLDQRRVFTGFLAKRILEEGDLVKPISAWSPAPFHRLTVTVPVKVDANRCG